MVVLLERGKKPDGVDACKDTGWASVAKLLNPV